MEFQPFIEEVRTRAGLGTYEEAVGAAEATLETLGEVIQADDRNTVANDLPDSLASALRRSQGGQHIEPDEFYERVTERERAPSGLAMQHAQAVCQALAQSLNSEQRSKLRGLVPEDFRFLFEPPGTARPGEVNESPETQRMGDRVQGRGRPAPGAGPMELEDIEQNERRKSEERSPIPEKSPQSDEGRERRSKKD